MNVRAIASAAALVLAAACTTTGSQSRGTEGSAQAPDAAPPQAPATASGAAAGQDPLMRPGPEVKAHASDDVVAGEIGAVTATSVTIDGAPGTRVLEIAPETSITVDGEEATLADLEEGQPVRASFSEVQGRDVAVEIEVERAPSLAAPGEPEAPAIPAPMPPDPVDPVDPLPGGPSGGTGAGGGADEPGPPPPNW
jgi:hypothetical protein